MKTISYLIAALTLAALIITAGTGLGMRSLGIWAFKLHKAVGISSLVLGIIHSIMVHLKYKYSTAA